MGHYSLQNMLIVVQKFNMISEKFFNNVIVETRFLLDVEKRGYVGDKEQVLHFDIFN